MQQDLISAAFTGVPTGFYRAYSMRSPLVFAPSAVSNTLEEDQNILVHEMEREKDNIDRVQEAIKEEIHEDLLEAAERNGSFSWGDVAKGAAGSIVSAGVLYGGRKLADHFAIGQFARNLFERYITQPVDNAMTGYNQGQGFGTGEFRRGYSNDFYSDNPFGAYNNPDNPDADLNESVRTPAYSPDADLNRSMFRTRGMFRTPDSQDGSLPRARDFDHETKTSRSDLRRGSDLRRNLNDAFGTPEDGNPRTPEMRRRLGVRREGGGGLDGAFWRYPFDEDG